MGLTDQQNPPRSSYRKLIIGKMLGQMLASRQKLKDYVLENAQQSDVQNIVDTIDKFCWTQQWMMNIGDRKGLILDQELEKHKPKTILELGKDSFHFINDLYLFCHLGTFLGYSSLRMSLHLPNGSQIYSVEADAESAKIARALHEFAGVTDRITVINDYTENVIPKLKETYNLDSLDLIFIDHHNNVYLRDLKLLEESGLIRSGTVIVADNVIYPGAPDYLQYIRNNSNYTTTFHNAKLEYSEDKPDGVEVSIRK